MPTPDSSRDTLSTLFKAVNSRVINPATVRERVRHEHHWIQAAFMRAVIKPALRGLAESAVDGRNRTAVTTAREICDERGWEYDAPN